MDDYLYYLSSCCSDLVYPYFVRFMEEQMKHEDRRCHYIAIKLILGVDPKHLKKLLQSVMPFLLEMLRDAKEDIKCFTLKAIRDTYNKGPSTYLSEPYLKPLIQLLLLQLNSPLKIATAASEVLSSLAYAAFFTPSDAKVGPEDASSVLPSNKYCFQLIVHKILDASSRTDAVGLCKSTCEALRDIIRYTPEDCYEVFKELTREILDRLLSVVASDPSPNANESANAEEIQTCLVTSLEGVLKRVRPDDAPEICDNIVFALLQMYNCTSCKSAHLRKAVLGVVFGREVFDVCVHYRTRSRSWVKELQRGRTIVIGVGSTIKSYLGTILSSMIEASQAEVAQFAYLNVYSQILKVLKEDCDVYPLVQPYLSGMMRLIESIADDKYRSDVCVAAACDLLGTICCTFGTKVRHLVDTKPISDMINIGRSSLVDKTNATATCAHIEIEKLHNFIN
uniref:Importin subunit beta-1/Transportin-1-like TPR repeats domain-containing protein n=1 Tax=Strigamia maritima TaxID=126957 RepID=T1IHV9_STRMM